MKKTLILFLLVAVITGSNQIIVSASSDTPIPVTCDTEALTVKGNTSFEEYSVDKDVLSEKIKEIKTDMEGESIDDTRARIEESVREEYENDEQYLMQNAENPSGAEEMIQTIIDNRINREKNLVNKDLSNSIGINSLAANTSSKWSVSNPVIFKQSKTWNCGPASALIAIAGWNGYVKGSTNAKKMATLETAMGSNSSDGTMVYKMVDVLNTYTSGYAYKKGSRLDSWDFMVSIEDSVAKDKAPILHAKTKYLDYYNGHNTGHYIAIVADDSKYTTVTLHDTNRDDAYYGAHEVPMSQAHDAVSATERYLISAAL
ncbi:hypothetical protein Ami103574_13835 [Aminipila butyrica]|uniref:Peptidase C39-like domain-containing protein n=1 Tax=Aminipila butyrica TaxID=433296 RepID=A0A858BYU5_9FIRM|nr:C39 family peptidase [Aminipila butyrica]QIB70305.1 hypothetical protein Ami103574_13835 [Aminipila butyrica]